MIPQVGRLPNKRTEWNDDAIDGIRKPRYNSRRRIRLQEGLVTLDDFFEGQEESRQLFDALRSVVDAIGVAELRVTKSQIAFRRRRAFAWAWIPGRYLHGRTAPLVLTLGFRHRDPSPRWKEIVEPSPGQFTHHLELWSTQDIDHQVSDWLREAWLAAA